MLLTDAEEALYYLITVFGLPADLADVPGPCASGSPGDRVCGARRARRKPADEPA
jgi:hypothetical protein